MDVSINFSNKRALAGLIVLICLIGLAFYLPGILTNLEPAQCTVNGVCQHEEYANFLSEMVPVFIIIGVVIGALVFFFMSSRLEDKSKNLKKVSDILVQFLAKDEKLIVQKLLDNDGKILQAEISRIEGIGKLRSHRVIQRLSDRGVIEVEHFGKTNIVKLSKGVKEALIFKK
jgi:uncharacterized membrane protein